MEDDALIVAVSLRAVFGAEDREVSEAGVAVPLLQALRAVNERLSQVASDADTFRVILVCTEREQQQQAENIQSLTAQNGLQVHQFCFSNENEFTESLLHNKVQLFLTSDSSEAIQAVNRGVFSVLLDPLSAAGPSEQLRVLFFADAILDPSSGLKKEGHQVLGRLGRMRQKLGLSDSPLSLALLSSQRDLNSCCEALKSLRADGVNVDEAYCLGGSPLAAILPLLRPHFLLGVSKE